jgi:acyl-CoA hydrolase
MEVGVKVWMENYIIDKREHVASAHLTFVAVDGLGGRVPVPQVIPQGESQIRRFEDAALRRAARQAEVARRQKE